MERTTSTRRVESRRKARIPHSTVLSVKSTVGRGLSMGRSISVRKPLLVFGLLFFFVLGRFPAAAQDQKPMGSGIELTGRSDKDPPPQVWHVEDATTKKRVASVDSRWGFTPLPPGQYRVSLLPVGWHPLEIPWGERNAGQRLPGGGPPARTKARQGTAFGVVAN